MRAFCCMSTQSYFVIWVANELRKCPVVRLDLTEYLIVFVCIHACVNNNNYN